MTSPLLEIEPRAYLTKSAIADRRKIMDADVWAFMRVATPQGMGFVERFHRPMAYLLAGDALRLAASLNAFDSAITQELKRIFQAKGYDWNTRAGIARIHQWLFRVDERVARGFAKTSVGLRVILKVSSVDPNLSIGIASKSDKVAQIKMCSTIGGMMLTDDYVMYYPERLAPSNPEQNITKEWIQMHGRDAGRDQKSIEARGINSQWTGNHYDWIYADDIVGTESGEASTEDAIKWIATLNSISKKPGLGESRHIFNGTIYGKSDDHAELVKKGTFLSIVIPGWKKDVPHSLANIEIDGVATLPEWINEDQIRAERAETCTGQLGRIAWLQNFELSAADTGAFQFDTELLKRSKFLWTKGYKQVGSTVVPIRVMRRYLFTPKGEPIRNKNFKADGDGGQCRCARGCRFPDHAYREFDPYQLPRVMAVDQAFKTKGGDRWATCPAAQDPDGHVYILRGEVGRGYPMMIASIPIVFRRWGGMKNPPEKVGIESNAAQGVTATWLQMSDEFRYLADLVVKLSPGNIQKNIRIFNNLYGGMLAGRVHIDPDFQDFDSEALGYDPNEKEPADDLLDAAAMDVTLFEEPPADYSEGRRELDNIRAEQQYFDSHDHVTGIDLTNWMTN